MFKPIKSKKIYESVIEEVQQMIIEGTLSKGDKLPTERDLAEQLNVSRTSVREAMRALEVLGIVQVKQGGGNFIKEQFDDALVEPLSMMFILNQSHPREIVELRRIIEVESVYRAAERISDEDIKELRVIIDQLNIHTKSRNEIKSAEYDKEFHYSICRIADNYLFSNILNMVSNLMDVLIKDARGTILLKEHNRDVLIEQHEKIFRALAARNPQGAADAMKEHIELIFDEYVSSIEERKPSV
ncbi:FadR/GntR family transcriptional regulator [Isachenkonia alkalipeptolytica]|uniref:FadR family transcriptional regulator n=1 Tax=Isachenkonia alkalipeptolytica TaxID=2565777 RepID=A0AA43XJK0_9CLOT|nr:FadR/GntR family transcriptional regulator [Isachenkonia alkalipeptolytica]NBG87742.1 FadR family transcriptional regulator [Isachenkonia alkalipeptolytica]